MQNSSFLFNYDSEDSSAHYSSSYQSNSQSQSTGEQVDRNAKPDFDLLQRETQSDEPGRSFDDTLPNNERDGSANADKIEVRQFQDEIAVEKDDATSTIIGDNPPTLSTQENSKQIDARTVWQNTLAELALQMPAATYDTWMRDTSVIAYEDGEFIIGLPNAYARDWIMNRLQNKIKRILSKLISRSVQVTFRVVPTTIVDSQDAKPAPLYDSLQTDSLQRAHPNSESLDALQHKNGLQNYSAPTQATDSFGGNQRAADSTESTQIDSRTESLGRKPLIDKSTIDNFSPSQSGFHQQDNEYYATPQSGGIDGTLRSGYTFDTFIVGSHNQLAHAAAASIADGPGNSFNPLFIYGGVGLGKTHLLHAVGNLAAARGSRVLYCTSEQFTNELITSIRGRGTEEFRSKYRQVDVLLIDDIQFIAGKESTQEEFFHTFNHLHTAGRQVVLSSDRPPKALATLEERLRSRFEGGLLTDISQPDFETRVAILQSKANKSGIRINADVLMLIAERVDSNIRELEGALNRMVVQARLFSNTLDLQLAESILRNLAPQRSPRSPSIVIRIVAEHFHLTSDDMSGRSRTKEIANARQIAMYLLREENGMSLPSIGDQLGGRDHSTVRHGVEKINKDLESDEQLRREIMSLRDKVYSAPEAI